MFVNYMPFSAAGSAGRGPPFSEEKERSADSFRSWDDSDQLLFFGRRRLLALTAYAVTEYLKCGTENAAYEAEQENRKVSRNQKAGAEKKQRAGENLPERVKPWWVCGAFLAQQSALRFRSSQESFFPVFC